jgi:hypothetical protein
MVELSVDVAFVFADLEATVVISKSAVNRSRKRTDSSWGIHESHSIH